MKLGNNGLGKETVLQLARHHASKIYIASRSESKGLEAIKAIRESIGEDSSTDLQFVQLDLTSFDSIRSAAAKVQWSTTRLDILICNAGVMAVPAGKTEQGHEIQFGTNHIGHHLLVKLLLPTLLQTAQLARADVRVVVLSSLGHDRAPALDTMLDTNQLSATGTWTKYGASKAANIYFAAELARRYPALTCVSVHPGMIKSDLWNTTNQNNALVRFGLWFAGPILFRSIESGARNTLWAAAGADKKDLENGAYYTPVGKFQSTNSGNARARDKKAGQAVWDWTEAEIADVGSD